MLFLHLTSIHLGKSPTEAFGKGKQDLEDDWMILCDIQAVRSSTDSSAQVATRQRRRVQTLFSPRGDLCAFLFFFLVLALNVEMPSSGDKTAPGRYPFVVRLTVTSVKSMEVTV